MAPTYDETVPGLSEQFRWLYAPRDAQRGASELTFGAGPRTDWFIDPETRLSTWNAPALVASSTTDFVLSAHVEVTMAASFDAGSLVLWGDNHCWAKLALERSPQGEPMIVSVVTRDTSDDCNSVVLDTSSVWLRVAQRGDAYAFHYSRDAAYWHFVRHFRLYAPGVVEVGFEAQSPLGDGCTVTFSDARLTAVTLEDLRCGV